MSVDTSKFVRINESYLRLLSIATYWRWKADEGDPDLKELARKTTAEAGIRCSDEALAKVAAEAVRYPKDHADDDLELAGG